MKRYKIMMAMLIGLCSLQKAMAQTNNTEHRQGSASATISTAIKVPSSSTAEAVPGNPTGQNTVKPGIAKNTEMPPVRSHAGEKMKDESRTISMPSSTVIAPAVRKQ